MELVELTEEAKRFLKTRQPAGGYVSLGINGGGCAGFQYEWNTTKEIKDGTLIDNIFVVDPMTEMYIVGSTIDYVHETFGSYLKIVNPKATSSCGCGESFGV
jgi:iron-sulfur cluster assembly accessory protein